MCGVQCDGLDGDNGFEQNYRSVGYGTQCSLAWSYVEERGWSCLEQCMTEIKGQKKKGRLKRTWKKQVEEESMNIRLSMKDAHCRSKWIISVNLITSRLRLIWSPTLLWDIT